MQLTAEQRLRELERKVSILTDTLKVMHNLIKDNRLQIKDFILNGLKNAHSPTNTQAENAKAEGQQT